jgi:surface antigen
MASPGIRQASRLPLYSGTQDSGTQCARLWRANLWRTCTQLPVTALVFACALASSGCALSYRLDSLLGKNSDRKDEITGSFSKDAFAAASTADLLESDLVYAKAVASDLLARGGKDASAPWENPTSGAHGTVTPTASAEARDGVLCRDFLASYIHANTQAWLQGEACRRTAGRWEVKSLKPLNRT